ncbi:hypothetical protein OG574_41630 [Streptomyces sp. NBC_01445]|nr:hypothetical protein OG574_41630 [Streptomyces sp. NBC_01445]
MEGWVAGPLPGYSFDAADLAAVNQKDAVPDWTNPAARSWVWRVSWKEGFDSALKYPGDGLWLDEPDELGRIPYNADAANGWKWSGYACFADSSADGAFIEWTVDVPDAGTRTLTFRYANGGPSDRPLSVSVNGSPCRERPAVPPDRGWATWKTTYVAAALPVGRVTTRATTAGSNGAHMDSLTIH